MFENTIDPILLWIHSLWIVWVAGAIVFAGLVVLFLYLDDRQKKSGSGEIKYMFWMLVSGFVCAIFLFLFNIARDTRLLI